MTDFLPGQESELPSPQQLHKIEQEKNASFLLVSTWYQISAISSSSIKWSAASTSWFTRHRNSITITHSASADFSSRCHSQCLLLRATSGLQLSFSVLWAWGQQAASEGKTRQNLINMWSLGQENKCLLTASLYICVFVCLTASGLYWIHEPLLKSHVWFLLHMQI